MSSGKGVGRKVKRPHGRVLIPRPRVDGFGANLGAIIKRSWGVLERSWCILKRSWNVFGMSWGGLKAILGRLGASRGVLGTSWAVYKRSWGVLGPSTSGLGVSAPFKREDGEKT